MMPTGYTSSKPVVNVVDPQTGKVKDTYQVMVSNINLKLSDFICFKKTGEIRIDD
jgi:hypothetical protein